MIMTFHKVFWKCYKETKNWPKKDRKTDQFQQQVSASALLIQK